MTIFPLFSSSITIQDEICGVVDIDEADNISLPERKRARMMAEKEKFDDSHYL